MFNLPNCLTLLRICLIPIFAYFFLKTRYDLALLLFCASGVSDVLDGFLARRLGQQTNLGSVLDPVADKLLMLVGFIILAISHWVPVWLSILVISRDVWIVGGVVILKILKKKLYFKPTKLSKLNTLFQLSTIFLAFFLAFIQSDGWLRNLSPYQILTSEALHLSIIFTAGMTILTGIQYTRIGVMILRGKRDYADISIKEN